MIPRQVQLSRSWKVNLDAAELCPQSAAENQAFIAGGEQDAALVAFAARALNAEIIALDYSKKPDGSYIFWEGNRNFDLSIEGEMWRQYQYTTGLSEEECVKGCVRSAMRLPTWSLTASNRRTRRHPSVRGSGHHWYPKLLASPFTSGRNPVPSGRQLKGPSRPPGLS